MSIMMDKISIVGDFGGTNARLALSTPQGIEGIKEYTCANFPNPGDVIRTYIEESGFECADRAVIAVAGDYVDPTKVMFSNGRWKLRPLDFTDCPVGQVDTIHDFAAICYGTATLSADDCTVIINGHAAPFFPSTMLTEDHFKPSSSRILLSNDADRFVTIGPGTGLGVGSGLVTSNGQLVVVTSEGSHAAFVARDAEELAIKQYVESELGLVATSETFACGSGLVTAFNAICQVRGVNANINSGGEVVKKLEDADAGVRDAAQRTLKLFATTFGACASSAVLMNCARTLFVGGGVLGKMKEHFDKQAFREAFISNDLKDRNFLGNVPVMQINHPQPGLAGADFYLKLTAA